MVRTLGQQCERVIRNRSRGIHEASSITLRIRIRTIPALRYEGFNLSSYQVGETYEVDERLAELLLEHGYAERATAEPACRRTTPR